MHLQQLASLVAAERVKEMQAAATRRRRAREARCARRGAIAVRATDPNATQRDGEPASQQPCPPEVLADR